MDRMLIINCVALITLAGCTEEEVPIHSNAIQLRDLDRYVRITDKLYELHDSTIAYYRPPEELAGSPHGFPGFRDSLSQHLR